MWEIAEGDHAYMPHRLFGGIGGVVIRINESRWVSIGTSTNAPLGRGFDSDPVPGGDPFSIASSPVWKYGATLWEDQFDGELRRIQQITLLNTYGSNEVKLDTSDGITWTAACLREQTGVGPSGLNPRWSIRRLIVDMTDGTLTAGPLVVHEYPGDGSQFLHGSEFALAALTPSRAILMAGIGRLSTFESWTYAVAIDTASGAVGASSHSTPMQLGFRYSPAGGAQTPFLTAARLSDDEAVCLCFPLNAYPVSESAFPVPSPWTIATEARFDANAQRISVVDLVRQNIALSSGTFASFLSRPLLNMVFLPLVLTGRNEFGQGTYSSYAWVGTERRHSPELTYFNANYFTGEDDIQKRNIGWYGDDDHPHGTVAQRQRLYDSFDASDYGLVTYPPLLTIEEYPQVPEKGFWFNTYTDYSEVFHVDPETFAATIGDFVDQSPGQEFFDYIWMLSPEFWCGIHRDTEMVYGDPTYPPPRYFIITWGTGGGGARRAATHESGTARIQRGVR